MNIKACVEQQGWEVEQHDGWLSVWDRRPEFRSFSSSSRLAKIIGPNFYVVPAPLASTTLELVAEIGAAPKKVKSTRGASNAEYVGFDTRLPNEKLTDFVTKLSAAINDLLQTARG